MPPGRHAIQPKNTATGRGVKLNVTVGEKLVAQLNAQAEQIRKQGHQLFVDFNHNEDNGAAAHVDDFFWAGDNPETGGIRAHVRWTAKGAQALTGREFTRFSPCFAADRSGKIGGLSTANVGGLTNRPAFGDNERIVQATETTETMDPEEIKTLVATAIAEALPGAVKTAIVNLKAEDGTPPGKKEDGKEAEEDEEKEELKKRLAAYEKKENEALKNRVEKIVATATELGIVAPKDEKAVEAFRAQATQSPELAETLLASKAPAAGEGMASFAASITPEGGPNNRADFSASADNIEHQIRQYAAENKVDEATAFSAVCAKNPSLAK